MCHNSEIQRTTSIVKVLAIAIILMAIVYAVKSVGTKPAPVTGFAGAARTTLKVAEEPSSSKNGSGRGCGCGDSSEDFYHHDRHHDKHHNGHHYYPVPTPLPNPPVPTPLPNPPVPTPLPASNYAIRLVHAAPDVRTPLTVTVNGVKVAENIVYGSVTKYLNVPSDTVTIGLLSKGVQVATIPLTLPVNPIVTDNQYFTVAAVPTDSPLRGVPPIAVKTLVDPAIDVTTNPSVNSGLRFYHLSPAAPGVDIYANNKKLFSNVVYGTEVFTQVPAGTYSVDVVPTGKPLTPSNIVYKNDNVVVAANTILSIIAQGTKQLNVITAVSNE